MTTAAAPLHYRYSNRSSATRGTIWSYFNTTSTNVGSTELNRFEAEVELPLCDFKDVTLVVLEGKCSLTWVKEVMTWNRNARVYPRSHSSYAASTSWSHFLLSRCEPDPAASDSVWLSILIRCLARTKHTLVLTHGVKPNVTLIKVTGYSLLITVLIILERRC